MYIYIYIYISNIYIYISNNEKQYALKPFQLSPP